jgi:acyl-CoA synthetase (AMP-forming)/AMP-acid ligase II
MLFELKGLEESREVRLCEPAADDSIASRFLVTACRFADHPAVVTRLRSYSYGQIAAAALRISEFLRQRSDFTSHTRVALIAGNSPEYLSAFFGIALARGIIVPLPGRMESPALKAVLEDCDARLLLSGPNDAPRLRTTLDSHVQQLDLARQSVASPAVSAADGPDQGVLILYTSGSTGSPKGVLLSHRNLVGNAESILKYLPIRQSDRALNLLPFCHAFGNSVLTTHLLSGATLILDGSTTFPNTILDALQRHRATSFAGVPEMYSSLLACSDLGVRQMPDLRYMTVAGAALAPNLALEVAEKIAPAQFFVMYGQTEATARLAYLPPDELPHRPNSIGKAIPDVELRVRDRDGHRVPVGETGELCARGPNIMRGYWQNAAATARVLKDGWLHTGDLAREDDRGFFYVAGRVNDQIKIRGLKVVPGQIAALLERRLPECRVAVVPFEHFAATRLALFVATTKRHPAFAQQVRRLCSEELSRHQMPCHVEVLDRLPLTPSLKVDFHRLANHAAQQVASGTTPVAACTGGTVLESEVKDE